MHRILLVIAFSTLIGLPSKCTAEKKLPIPGAYHIDQYKSLLAGKSVAVLANQTSMVGKTHLVDTLLGYGIKIKVIFAPEHGFRNMADAGETIEDGKDAKTRE